MRDGASLYGAFVAVVLVCSKQDRPRDGHLTDTGRAEGVPYDAEGLSIKTQIPTTIIDRMLKACSDVTIGWIIAYDSSARVVPVECPRGALEEKRREEKEEKEAPSAFEAFDQLIPEQLKDGRFISAWHSWVNDRKERRKALTIRAAELQLSKLKAFGVEKAIRAIDAAIEKSWTGIFDPDHKFGEKPKPVSRGIKISELT
jgi:hypothetical protein